MREEFGKAYVRRPMMGSSGTHCLRLSDETGAVAATEETPVPQETESALNFSECQFKMSLS